MLINRYEHSKLKNKYLPNSWQSQTELEELERFLQDNWEQREIFYEDKTISSQQQFLKFLSNGDIKTQNYIGTIAFNGCQLNIFPKIFREDKDDSDTENLSQSHLMHNLVTWIEYCNKMNYPFISISSELQDTSNLKELFITLFVHYVKNAIDRGLFYRYVEETNDLRLIRGKFNYKDYLIKKLPNGQAEKFSCTYSTFEFDNLVNRIIKRTCILLLSEVTGKNRNILRRILTKLEPVSDTICTPSDCDAIRLGNMHSNYRVILSMCKIFMLNSNTNYALGNTETFCFLFPSELLFEGFIGGFMQEVLSPIGGNVKLQRSDMSLIDDIVFKGQSLGNAFTMRHDILVEMNDRIFILDTKYKEVSRFEDNVDEMKELIASEPKQTDIYQVLEYARKRGLNDVFLLYPMFRYEDAEHGHPIGISKDEKGNAINVHFVRVPFVFEENDNSTKKQLTDVILSIFGIDAQ